MVGDALEDLHLAGAAVALLAGVEHRREHVADRSKQRPIRPDSDRDALSGELDLEGVVVAGQLRRNGAVGSAERSRCSAPAGTVLARTASSTAASIPAGPQVNTAVPGVAARRMRVQVREAELLLGNEVHVGCAMFGDLFEKGHRLSAPAAVDERPRYAPALDLLDHRQHRRHADSSGDEDEPATVVREMEVVARPLAPSASCRRAGVLVDLARTAYGSSARSAHSRGRRSGRQPNRKASTAESSPRARSGRCVPLTLPVRPARFPMGMHETKRDDSLGLPGHLLHSQLVGATRSAAAPLASSWPSVIFAACSLLFQVAEEVGSNAVYLLGLEMHGPLRHGPG